MMSLQLGCISTKPGTHERNSVIEQHDTVLALQTEFWVLTNAVLVSTVVASPLWLALITV